MSYPYKNKPNADKIAELRARVEVMEWDSITGEVPTWYAWQEIDIMERQICELQELICDSLMNETRKIG